MVHEMKLRAVYFDKIKAGQKIYEGRLFDEKRNALALGARGAVLALWISLE